jgi:hypothetical protein
MIITIQMTVQLRTSQSRDVHLGEADLSRDLILVLEEPQNDDLAL